MFNNLKLSTANQIRKIAILATIDFLLKSKDGLKEDVQKKLAPDNPNIPNDVEIPAEQAAVGAVGWVVDITVAFLRAVAV